MEIWLRSRTGRPAPEREWQEGEHIRKTSAARCWYGNRIVSKTTKNEPVAGWNVVHGARPCKGAALAPWIWADGTKEVRTPLETEGDPGRHGRCAAIEGRVRRWPCRSDERRSTSCTHYHLYSRTRCMEMLIIRFIRRGSNC